MKERIQRFLNKDENKFPLKVLGLVIVFFIIINQITKFRPDHAFLALLIITLSFGKKRSRQFLVDWAPLILFWIAYDMMRGVADSVRGVIHVIEPYQWEHSLFGWIFGGEVPSFWFQDFQHWLGNNILQRILDLLAANFYTLHFAIPVVVGWVFWHTTNDRRIFYRYFYTLTVLNILALITFMAFPAAPPWYVYHHGFVQPTDSSFFGLSAGALINVDKLLGKPIFSTVWDSFNPNYFAAIPSLHGAYPVVTAIFLFQKFKRYKIGLILYCIGVWWGAVYLNQHYIVDLLIGVGYIGIAYWVVEKLLYPHIFARFLEKEQTQDYSQNSRVNKTRTV